MTVFTDLAYMLGSALGATPSTAQYLGGMILSMAALMTVGLSMTAFHREDSVGMSSMVISSGALLVCTGLCFVVGWLDFAFVAIIVLVVGLLFALQVRRTV